MFMPVLLGEIIEHKKWTSCKVNFTTLCGLAHIEYHPAQSATVRPIEQLRLELIILLMLCRTL